jgi:hypothetical protein
MVRVIGIDGDAMKKQFVGFLVFWLAAVFGGSLYAQTALIVASLTSDAAKTLSLADLQALDQIEVKTSNEFVDGERVFRGPLVRNVLGRFGDANAKTVTFTAANDYQVDVDVAEFYKYNAILALTQDGVALSKRDKGPIWVIYPMSDFVELRDPVYNSRLIWQLVKLEYR